MGKIEADFHSIRRVEERRIADAFKAWHSGQPLTSEQRELINTATIHLAARNWGLTL